MVTLKWKIYIYNTSSSNGTYSVSLNNTKANISYSFTAANSIAGCSTFTLVGKNAVSISSVVANSNLITFAIQNAKIGIS